MQALSGQHNASHNTTMDNEHRLLREGNLPNYASSRTEKGKKHPVRLASAFLAASLSIGTAFAAVGPKANPVHTFKGLISEKANIVNSAEKAYPDYVLMIGETSRQSHKRLSGYVTATSQTDSHGIGSSSLINGNTNYHDWNQFGLGYNQQVTDPISRKQKIIKGFSLIYEQWMPSGAPKELYVIPIKKNAVRDGDSLKLLMTISNNMVTVSCKNMTPGNASAPKVILAPASFATQGSEFIGSSSNIFNRPTPGGSGAYFTGSLFEFHSIDKNQLVLKRVDFQPETPNNVSPWVWIVKLREDGPSSGSVLMHKQEVANLKRGEPFGVIKDGKYAALYTRGGHLTILPSSEVSGN